MRFEKWMNAIDKACLAKFMVSIYDLPDQDFQGYFKAGMTPNEALDEIADQEDMDIDDEVEVEENNGDYRHAADLARNEDFSGFTV